MAKGKMGASAPTGSAADYWHAAYQVAGELAAAQGRLLVFNFTPTRRLGVWRLQARVCEVVDGRPVRVVVQRSIEWPNSSVARLEAQAYQLALAAVEEASQDGLGAAG